MINTKEDIIKHRLGCQQISQKKFTRPEDLVSWMGCIQAQEFASAKWAIGSRLIGGGGDAAIVQLFNDGKILRTHILRPTWHFVAPEDIRWMLALTAPRIKAWSAGYRRQLGMEEDVFSKSQRILKRTLKEGRQLTRKELGLALRWNGIRTDDERIVHLLMEAELDGVICSGGMRGTQFTYALMEDRVPAGKVYKREEALGELALRYFRSRGPATLGDFAWWSGLMVADAKAGVEGNRSQYGHFEMEGKTYWYYSGSGSKGKAGASAEVDGDKGLYALPAFDEYTVAYTDRDLVIHPRHVQRSANGIFKPILVKDGRITGLWHRSVKKDHVVVKTDLFKPVGKRLIQSAFVNYSAFMGKEVAL